MATNKVLDHGQLLLLGGEMLLGSAEIDLQSHEKHAPTFMTSQSKSHLPAI